MASLVKRGRKWSVRYTDADGRKRIQVGFTDKRMTEALSVQIEAEVKRVKLGLTTPADEKARTEAGRKLTGCLVPWQGSMRSEGCTEKHILDYAGKVAWLIERAGVERVSDLDTEPIQSALLALRAKGRSLRTVQHYSRAARAFSAWLRRTGRTKTDALGDLAGPSHPESDRRHRRRALTPGEVERLVSAAESGPPRAGLSGPDRAMLYRVAVGTGLRASELASLAPASFDLDSTVPAVTVEAGYSKRRRRDTQPIASGLAALLRPYLSGRPLSSPLWPLDVTHAAATIRSDLASAGIAYEDASGRRADFHALRVTYVSLLARAGTPLQVAQRLARHSTPLLTSNTYTDLGVCDPVGAVESLPVAGARTRRALRGTQGDAA